jgi:hypothetical protein
VKIIAVKNDGYLVDMSDEEIDALCLESVRHCYREKQIGREFKIRDAWKLIRKLQDQKDQLGKAASQLRCMADLLEPVVVSVQLGTDVVEESEL